MPNSDTSLAKADISFRKRGCGIDSDMENLIRSIKVMTLAAPWKRGIWSAPLYYFYKNGNFYFFSSPTSRHIVGATTSSSSSSPSPSLSSSSSPVSVLSDQFDMNSIPRGKSDFSKKMDTVKKSQLSSCAASIFHDDPCISRIKGIQMQGGVEKVTRKREAVSIAVAYAARFGLSSPHATDDMLTFLQQQFRAALYKFTPSRLVYMDNSVRIGFKEEIEL